MTSDVYKDKKVLNALISVSDKSGVVELARELRALGVNILSTGGTAKALRQSAIDVVEISEYTGFPEIMDGRVKTLHPKVYGGILARRDNATDMDTIQRHGINRIDMVVVNLYPFRETIRREGATMQDAIENIDIGGPAMIRAAAKNFQDVIVVVDPGTYGDIIAQMKQNDGHVSIGMRVTLAERAFAQTALYDTAISEYLKSISRDDSN
ncbi:purine biosynthesis protein purH [Candidatus Magnetobacterium bavaricum]|uniref:Purine biosynthesis protein purH n=1 Tax=Candidatus Magnetobacterium bavaricum TaxID=29290 RepID=A0A0F3GZW3_9BACT|nr:purine biosynthesis protein purH [Candidatus Magnetobacterium bavaricum]